jgi:hypothetical protein
VGARFGVQNLFAGPRKSPEKKNSHGVHGGFLAVDQSPEPDFQLRRTKIK